MVVADSTRLMKVLPSSKTIMDSKRKAVRGVIADLVIPYASDASIDWDCLKREVRLLNDCGVHGFSVGGALGGTLGASAEDLASLCAEVKRSAKAPLCAIVFPDTTPEALEMVRAVNDAGADMIAVAQPHYLSQPGSDGLVDMFAELRRATPRALVAADSLPSYVLGVQTIEALVATKLIDGVLESADIHVLVDLLCLDLGIPVYSGIEDLHYLAFILGVDGVISNFATVCPAECVQLHAAFQEGNHPGARKIHERLVRLWRSLNWGVEQEARIRSALLAQGRPVGPAPNPYDALPSGAAQQIFNALREEGLASEQQQP
jgi:4-hydroxy-tetrahydrodipicolinate synthase